MIVVAIKLSDHFTYGRLVRFALPSIAMMIFTSIYSVVDGLFVSNFAGKEALAAVNLVFPLAMALGSIGFMLGTGGSAIVSKTLGQGDRQLANRYFSLIIYVAIGAGADVALDAADVVLMKSRLSDVPAAIRLSRATLRNIHQNLFWAFFYNTLGIPLAAGVFVPLGLTLNPMFGAAAMSLSSFCVVSNALRLNLFKLRDPKHDHKRRKKPASANTAPAEEKTTTKKEKETMKKTMKIEGMMCAHCEAAVKKALEAIPEVVDAEVSHTAGTAVVTLQSPVDDAALKKAVEDKDYKVLGIE